MRAFFLCGAIMMIAFAISASPSRSDERPVSLEKLPKVVVDAVRAKYPTAVLVQAIEEDDDGETSYEVVIENSGDRIELTVTAAGVIEEEEPHDDGDEWTNDFSSEKDDLISRGKNPFFILEPGYQLVLVDGDEVLTITVLDETKVVDGVETRVVEERETEAGKPIEVSRNYFAISKRTNNVYYFGEDVDMYKNGKVSSHSGSWLAGRNNARFGLAMPGLPLLGARYQQEVAPDVAMDRSEVVDVKLGVKVAAGEFNNCLKIEESTPLEPGHVEEKIYAPGVGLVQDGSLKLVRYAHATLTK